LQRARHFGAAATRKPGTPEAEQPSPVASGAPAASPAKCGGGMPTDLEADVARTGRRTFGSVDGLEIRTGSSSQSYSPQKLTN